MDLAPANPEKQAPTAESRDKEAKRPGIPRISAKKWDVDPDELASFFGLE
jgi:hypothetical protein